MITHENTEPRKPRRVLVLGACGFIGQVLRKHLEAENVPVHALTSSDLDLAEPEAAEKLVVEIEPLDCLVMLAALTPDKGRDIPTLMRNLAMMASVCRALERKGCAQFVYFSSDAVYDTRLSQVSEETPASPQDLYGSMHYTRELMARSLQGVPVLVLRPTLVYGHGDTHNAYGPNRFRRMALREGKITLFGGGEETRDHIHVDDVAALTLRCLLRKSVGTLNLATGRSTSFRDVAELVAQQFESQIPIVTTPRQNAVTHRHYDVTNLIKAFPDFAFTALEQGVAKVHAAESAA